MILCGDSIIVLQGFVSLPSIETRTLPSRQCSPSEKSTDVLTQSHEDLLASTQRLLSELRLPPSEFALTRTAWLDQVQPWLKPPAQDNHNFTSHNRMGMAYDRKQDYSDALSGPYPGIELLQGRSTRRLDDMNLPQSPDYNSVASTVSPKHQTTIHPSGIKAFEETTQVSTLRAMIYFDPMPIAIARVWCLGKFSSTTLCCPIQQGEIHGGGRIVIFSGEMSSFCS